MFYVEALLSYILRTGQNGSFYTGQFSVFRYSVFRYSLRFPLQRTKL